MIRNAAIIIDGWGYSQQIQQHKSEFASESIQNLSKNIKNFLDSTKKINTVILATYDSPTEIYTNNTIWYKNSNEHLLENKSTKIDLYMQEFQKVDLEQPTYKDILEWQFDDKYQYAAHFPFEIQHHYNEVYLCGVAFDKCIRYRPLGVDYFKGVQYTNVFIKKDCVLDSDNMHPELGVMPEWQHMGGEQNIFKYIG